MRQEFEQWARIYPKRPGWRDGTFKGAPQVRYVANDVPAAVHSAFPNLPGILVEGSAGQGSWTDTPWVALLNPAVTTTVQEGYYVVYLLSLGGHRLYLTIAQGCTELKKRSGIPQAREELVRRASLMRSRLSGRTSRLGFVPMDLGTNAWRGKLYEASLVVGTQYDTSSLPAEGVLRGDLEEALELYKHLSIVGGWSPDDEIMVQAREECGSESLTQAKIYRQHRVIERQPGHSRQVKKRQGTICKGCDTDLADVYGPVALGIIDAHHLIPLSALAEGETAEFDPDTDFAVLCPNCHRVIHRMLDVSDVPGLRRLIKDRIGPPST